MLKYNVNINDVYEDLERLDVIDIDLSDYTGNDGTETGQVYTTITVSDPSCISGTTPSTSLIR